MIIRKIAPKIARDEKRTAWRDGELANFVMLHFSFSFYTVTGLSQGKRGGNAK